MPDHPPTPGRTLRRGSAPADADPLWNESYYLDFVAGDGRWPATPASGCTPTSGSPGGRPWWSAPTGRWWPRWPTTSR